MLKGFNNVLKSGTIKRNFSTQANVKPHLNKRYILASGLIIAGGYFCWENYKTGPKMLDAERYVPLKMLKKEQISPDSYRLRLSTKQQIDKEFPVPSCLYIKDDTIQVMRAYTPINSNPYKDGFIDLVVKRYKDGSVSRTLSGFEPNDTVHVRGPMIEEYEYKENTLQEVGMIAGGTGIAPMYQLICRILENPNDKNTRIWLVYGNKKLQDILLKSELDQLVENYPDRLKIKYVLEDSPNDQYEKGFITKEIIQEMLNKKVENRKVFVCGPSKMLELICGERARDYSQGQVTGVLSHLGLSSNEVWKFQ